MLRLLREIWQGFGPCRCGLDAPIQGWAELVAGNASLPSHTATSFEVNIPDGRWTKTSNPTHTGTTSHVHPAPQISMLVKLATPTRGFDLFRPDRRGFMRDIISNIAIGEAGFDVSKGLIFRPFHARTRG